MDVKDVKKSLEGERGAQPIDASKLKRAAAILSGAIADGKVSPPVKLTIANPLRSSTTETQNLRKSSNSIISAVNLASAATTDMEKLVKSIDGIVQLVDKGELPERRAVALEKEANELVSKIKEIAFKASSDSSSTLPNDDVRSQVEARLGRSLDAIFPEEARKAFGLNELSLSKKELIIDTVANVRSARQRIENLGRDVNETRKSVEDIVASFEVAAQNSESAQATVRDVDLAVKLASETRNNIFDSPERALKSVGKLDSDSLELLE